MRLGLNVGYSGANYQLDLEPILEADKLGYHVVWTAEAYGSDAITPLAWIGARTSRIRLGTAIMQMPARTPAMTAMTAMTLDALSGGRFDLGLGVSGPQVVEGWHGQPFGKPVGKTREYVSILRNILAREAPLEHQGEYYQIPYSGPRATGLGKPLKSILHGRKDMKLFLAAIGPLNVAMAGEIADGLLPIFVSPDRFHIHDENLQRGFEKAGGGKNYDQFEVAASVTVIPGDDVQACLNFIKPHLALYIGGMGAKGKNFYNELTRRYGYEEAAETIQNLYLEGKKEEAAAAVPNELADEVSLVGPKERIAERLTRWNAIPNLTLNVAGGSLETVRMMAELAL